MTNTAKLIITGSALRVITLFATIAVSFFMMPFIIRSLGDEIYGLWVFIGSVISFYSLLDMGISNATQRFIAFVLPNNNDDELNEVINTSLAIYLIIGLIALAITTIIIFLAPYFSSQIKHLETFQVVIALLGTAMAINFPFMVINGILTANLRYDISCYISLLKLALRTSLMVYFLNQGYSLVAMAAITAAVDIIGHLITLQQTKRLAPQMRFSLGHYSRKRLPELANYAKFTFISMLADRFRQNTDNFIIAAYLSLSSVTIFAIATQLSMYFRSLITTAISVMLPLYTKYVATEDYDALRENFILVSRIGVLFTTTIAGGILIFGDTFINLWLGESYHQAYIPLIILIVAMTFEAIQSPSVNLLFALSKHNIYAYIGIAEGIANVILSILLVEKYGIIGIAIGTAIPNIIARVFVLPYYANKLINLSIRQYAFKLISLQSALVALHLPIFFLDQAIIINNFAQLIGISALCYTTYGIVAANLLLSKEEKEAMHTKLPFSKKIIFQFK